MLLSHRIDLFKLAKINRPSATPSTMVAKLSSRSSMLLEKGRETWSGESVQGLLSISTHAASLLTSDPEMFMAIPRLKVAMLVKRKRISRILLTRHA